MSHLSHDELLAAVEGGPSRDEHLAACASCRSEVQALSRVVRDVAATQVPEPSPLFWDHFSARVRDACSRDASDSRGETLVGADQNVGADQKVGTYRRTAWRVVVPAVAAVLLIVVAGRFVERQRQPAAAPAPAATTTAAVVSSVAPADESVAADDSWRAFAAVAAEADPAGTAFEAPPPGLADGAVLQMSDEERGVLIRLLEDELARGGARGRG